MAGRADDAGLPGLRLPGRRRPRRWCSGCSTPAAIYVGKTNLDQFATGLNGTRTPYPMPRSVFGGEPDLRRLELGLGAGGGRRARCRSRWPPTPPVRGGCRPALNGIVGFKPSRGLISTVGLVPACRSLDCISLIGRHRRRPGRASSTWSPAPTAGTRTPASAARRRPIPTRCRVGLPEPGRAGVLRRRADARRPTGGPEPRSSDRSATVVARRSAPFLAAGELLYQGPGWPSGSPSSATSWPSTRAVLPVIRTILEGGARLLGGRRLRGRAPARRAAGRGRRAVAARWTCWCCRPSAPPSPSTRCWPIRSAPTPRSATTPTSATCSTCAPPWCRPG